MISRFVHKHFHQTYIYRPTLLLIVPFLCNKTYSNPAQRTFTRTFFSYIHFLFYLCIRASDRSTHTSALTTPKYSPGPTLSHIKKEKNADVNSYKYVKCVKNNADIVRLTRTEKSRWNWRQVLCAGSHRFAKIFLLTFTFTVPLYRLYVSILFFFLPIFAYILPLARRQKLALPHAPSRTYIFTFPLYRNHHIYVNLHLCACIHAHYILRFNIYVPSIYTYIFTFTRTSSYIEYLNTCTAPFKLYLYFHLHSNYYIYIHQHLPLHFNPHVTFIFIYVHTYIHFPVLILISLFHQLLPVRQRIHV